MEKEKLLYEQSRLVQDKFTYFLLAVSASVIAFSVQEVSDRVFTLSLIPLGIAIILWGISFYFGCQNIRYVALTIYANYGLVLFDRVDNEAAKAASQGTKEAMENNSEKAARFSKRQYEFLIVGGLFYLCWQIIEMCIRSI